MTNEEALKSFEEENKDFQKIFERYGYQMSPEEVSAVKEAIERNKVAISALSALSEEDNTKWIDDGSDDDDFVCHCKKCGQEIFKVQKWFKFCPNCGRKAVQK